MKDFYIIKGNTDLISDYLFEKAFQELESTSGEHTYVVTNVNTRFYWFISERWLDTTVKKIKKQARETPVETTFEEFKKLYELKQELIKNL